MNKEFERRLRTVERLQQRPSSKRRIVPEWLLDDWHQQTGLPFDTDERALDSIQRMQQPEYRDRWRNREPESPSE